MFTWIKKNRNEFVVLLAILLISLFLRLYQIDAYMTFLGDEGRDALMIKRILTTADIPLIGPPTSIGNMYLGPLYYYMMSVPMAIFWLNPVAAAVMVAIIGTATIGLIYFFSRVWFGRIPAVVAAVLYAVSPVTITYSRSSWNPNPAPFFALLALLGLYSARKRNNFLWFILTGVSLAFAVQMHYLALILVPIFGIFWVYEFVSRKHKKNISENKIGMRNFWLGTVFSVLVFLLLMSPLLIFDIKHNWMNFRAISTFFSNRETTVNLNVLNTLGRLPSVYSYTLVGRYMGGENPWVYLSLAILILLIPIFTIYKFIFIRNQTLFIKSKKLNWPLFVLSVWLLVGVLGLGLYKQTIYDHYLGFLNPSIYLIIAALVGIFLYLKKINTYTKWSVVFILVALITYFNLAKSPLLVPPNNQLERTNKIADFIIEQSEGKPFNFALIAKHNYDAAYQFALDVKGHKPLQVPFDITDQLFVVCEDPICEPINHPKYEIAAFGWAKVERQEEFQGVKVFKLVHNKSQ
jgi:4-amino-4-deoxy-L-arabinose transferase-like glycosyltransferase